MHLQREFDLFLPRRTPSDVARLAEERGGHLLLNGLYVRVRGDRIHARYAASGRSTPPTMRGTLHAEGDGTRIVGRLYWRLSVLLTVFYGAAGLLSLAAVTVAWITNGPTSPPALLGMGVVLVTGVLLLIGHRVVPARPSYRQQLESALRERFGWPAL